MTRSSQTYNFLIFIDCNLTTLYNHFLHKNPVYLVMAEEPPIPNNDALIADVTRQADASMRGYYYQVLQSALAWIQLEENQTLHLETAEDFDQVANNKAITTQVKNTAENITLRSQSVIEAISNFWSHVQRNPKKEIIFRYLTTSAVGQEKYAPFGQGVKGIDLWESATEADAQKIKDFLIEEGKISAEVKTFLSGATTAQVLEKLVKPIRFFVESPSLSDVRAEIDHYLILHGKKEGVHALAAKKVTGQLIEEVYRIASLPEKPALRITNFYAFFKESTSVNIPLQLFEKFTALLQAQPNEFRAIDSSNGQAFQVDESAGPHDGELKEIKTLIDEFNTEKALERLNQLKRDIFSSTTDKAKHRILIYIGICFLRQNELDKGARLFLEALAYAPQQALALANAAFGAGSLGRYDEAEEYLKKAESIDPKEPYIYSVRISIASKETPLDELKAKVPIALKGAEKINYALGYAALNRNQIDQAVHFLELALAVSKNEIETRGALGSALLEQLYNNKDHLISDQLDPHTKQTLERIVDLLQGVWNDIAKADQSSLRYHWPMNLAQAYRHLGRKEDAVLCIDQVLAMRPEDSDVHKLKAIICLDVKDVPGAIKHALKINENISPEKPLLLAQYYQENNEHDLALASLKQALEPTKDKDVRINAFAFSALFLSKRGDSDEAKAIIEQGIVDYPESNLLKIHAGKLAYANGETEAAQAMVDAVLPVIVTNGHIVERIELGDLCLYLNNYGQAVTVYESFVDRRVDSPYLRRLIGSYVKIKQPDKALEFIANAAKYFQLTEFYAEIEGKIYEDTPDLAKAEIIYENFLKSNPDNFRIELRYAHLMWRVGRLEKVDRFLDHHKVIIFKDFISMQAFANLHLARNNMKRTLEIMYEARQLYYDNPKAHMQYIGLILMHGDSIARELDVTNITTGTSARINDGIQSKWLHIVEDVEQDLSARRYGKSHEMAKRLLGKKIGDRFHLEGTVPPTTMTVQEVKTKFIYALHESMELYSELFPNDKSLIRVNIEPTAPSEIPQSLRTMLDRMNQSNTSNLENYSKQQTSIYSLARILRKNPIETCYNMIFSKGMGFNCCLGTPVEREQAGKLLADRDVKIIIDLTSIITFSELGLLDVLKATYPNLYVCQTTIEEFKRYVDEKEIEARQGRSTIGKTDEGYFLQTISAESVQEFNIKLLKTAQWLEKQCNIAIPTQKLMPEAKKYVDFEFAFGASASDTVIAAASHNLLLLSDDILLRHICQQTAGVQGVWSQVALIKMWAKRYLSGKEYLNAVEWLIMAGHDFTTFDQFSMMLCVDQEKDEISDKLQAMLNVLVKPNSEVKSSLLVALNFLVEVWTGYSSELNKRKLTFAVFNTFFNIPTVGWEVLQELMRLCLLSQPYQPNMFGIKIAIKDWLIGHFLWETVSKEKNR